MTEQPSEQPEQSERERAQRATFEKQYQKWSWLYGPGGNIIPEKLKPYYIILFDMIRGMFLFIMVYFIFYLGGYQVQWLYDNMRDNVCPAVCSGAATFANGTIYIKPYANVSFGESYYGQQLIKQLNTTSATPER